MIAKNATFYVNMDDGKCYVHTSSMTPFDTGVYHIPAKVMMEARVGLLHRRKELYKCLERIDNDFYVMVERKPGEGFRKVVPTNPGFLSTSVSEMRDRTLRSIENSMSDLINVVYYIDPPPSIKTTVFLEYPHPAGDFEQVQLEPYTGERTDSFKALGGSGKFITIGEGEAPK